MFAGDTGGKSGWETFAFEALNRISDCLGGVCYPTIAEHLTCCLFHLKSCSHTFIRVLFACHC